MNIHFTDIKLFEALKKATLVKVKVGSQLYGLNDEESDIDFLYIYATSKAELNSFIQTNHQLQYKEAGIDHNFVSVHQFIRNSLNGDSTINYEVIQSDALIGTCLEFLTLNKFMFNTYTIMKSFLGLCNRDIRHFGKADTDRKKKKQLMHIIRGYTFAYHILQYGENEMFTFKEICETLQMINERLNMDICNKIVKDYGQKMADCRLIMNDRLDRKVLGLPKYMTVVDIGYIDSKLNILMYTAEFQDKQYMLHNFDMQYFWNAAENWVSYEN